jgi:hypothetical protein
MSRSANFQLRLALGMLARVRHAACHRHALDRTDEREGDRTSYLGRDLERKSRSVYHGGMNVFISHAEKDRSFARSLAKALVRAGVQVWEPGGVEPGKNWAIEMGKALERADAVIVLLSPAASASESVQREIEFAISSPQFKSRLIPVLVKPTRKVPWILQELPQWLEVSDPAAAARKVVEQLRPRRARRRSAPKRRKASTRTRASAAR